MSHQDIIQTLIEWIDEHIDQSLNNILMGHKAASLNSRFVVLSAGDRKSVV